MNRTMPQLLATLLLFCSFGVFAQSGYPHFAGGSSQTFAACQNSGANAVNGLLAVTDTNTTGTNTWSALVTPSHGTLAASYATAALSGTITPVGLSYRPTIGYVGTDSFRVRVTNGTYSDTTTVYVTVHAMPGGISGPSSVCNGNTITLANGTSGGSWSTSDVSLATITSTGSASGVSPGSVVISYTMPSGCGVSKTITVVPMPSAITGAVDICVSGGATTLSNAVGGGTWSSSNTAVATIAATTGIIYPVSLGTTRITYTFGSGCQAIRVQTVTGSPIAGTITGGTSVCVGATIALAASGSGGTWSNTNTSTTVGSTGTVTGLVAGTDTIVYTVHNVCGTATSTRAVSVLPLPVAGTISGPSTICVWATGTFSASVSGGSWSLAYTTASVSGGIVTGLSAGANIVSYSVSNTCGTAVATQSITIYPLPIAGTLSGSTFVCVGTSGTIHTSGSYGGIWSTTNATATISTAGSVTGVLPGIDTVIYTVTNICGTATASTTLSVLGLPVAGTISGTDTVCPGDTIMLSSTSTGGTWGSTTALSTVSGAGIVTGITTGPDTIVYTVTNLCGTDRATYPITINTLPDAGTITGAMDFCEGASITVSNAVSGGLWGGTTGAVFADTSGILYGIMGGIDTITYAVTNACGTAVASATVLVNPLPYPGILTGETGVCAGSSIVLVTDGDAGGTWSSSNTVSATVTGAGSSATVYGIAVGSTVISYEVSNACGTTFATADVSIDIPVPPIFGDITVCPFAFTLLINPAAGGTWASSAPLTAFVFAGNVIGIAPGPVTISYTLVNACGTSVATHDMTVLTQEECNPTSVTNVTANTEGINLFPNPATNAVNIQVASPIWEKVLVEISNAVGTKVLTKTMTTNANNVLELQLPAGIYLITAHTGGQRYTQKLTVQ